MLRITQLAVAVLLALLTHRPVFADMVAFDFDDIQSLSKKGPKASAIELYMEGLFGSDISVSQNTALGRAGGSPGVQSLLSPSAALGIQNGFLQTGKGRGAGISFDFGDNPIDSFSVDWLLRKRGKSFTIVADGVVIKHLALSKAQKKAGSSGHQDPYFFDNPVKELQFIGTKKKFAIDNLIINIPLEGPGETEEPVDPNESNPNEGGYPNETGVPNGNGYPNENAYPNGNGYPYGIGDPNWTGNPNDPGYPNENEPNGSINRAAVPEPSSILLLVLGLCSAWLTRRAAATVRGF